MEVPDDLGIVARTIVEVQLAEPSQRIPLVHRLNSLLHDVSARQQLQPDMIKTFLEFLYGRDVELAQTILVELFPLFFQEASLYESIVEAMPHVLYFKHRQEATVLNLLQRFKEQFSVDAVLEALVLSLSPNPFAFYRPPGGMSRERERRTLILQSAIDWLWDVLQSGENIPANCLQSIFNRCFPLCEMLPEQEQALLGQVLSVLYQRNPSVFHAVLTTFDPLVQEKIHELVPECMAVSVDSSFTHMDEVRGLPDESFAMASFSHEGGDMSFAMAVC